VPRWVIRCRAALPAGHFRVWHATVPGVSVACVRTRGHGVHRFAWEPTGVVGLVGRSTTISDNARGKFPSACTVQPDVLRQRACLVTPPAAWQQALKRGVLWTDWDVHTSLAPTPDGSGVLHCTDNGSFLHLTVQGAGGRTVEGLGDTPRTPTAQIIATKIDANYAAFVQAQTNDESASWRWVMYLWNRRAHTVTVIARNPVDAAGQPLRGGWVRPILTSTLRIHRWRGSC
jgi:hypothetical protein